ncbi:MAG: hypothetical protein HXY50_07605 [Ignavibacteriaceae bacterium]|nr:hypothetical protein [Ignavibacteriaceae bacterium]
MKNFLLYRVCTLILCLLTSAQLFAHKEWVHQHQVKQAYLLLKNQLGYDIPELLSHMGMNDIGEGPGPFLGCSVAQGAWEEDLYDPVWEVGGIMLGIQSYCGWDASSTHFWKADAVDNSSINIPLDIGECPLPNGEIPNAYLKAQHYLYGNWVINWKPGDNFTFTAQNGHIDRVERLIAELQPCVTIYFSRRF